MDKRNIEMTDQEKSKDLRRIFALLKIVATTFAIPRNAVRRISTPRKQSRQDTHQNLK